MRRHQVNPLSWATSSRNLGTANTLYLHSKVSSVECCGCYSTRGGRACWGDAQMGCKVGKSGSPRELWPERSQLMLEPACQLPGLGPLPAWSERHGTTQTQNLQALASTLLAGRTSPLPAKLWLDPPFLANPLCTHLCITSHSNPDGLINPETARPPFSCPT